MINKKQDLSGIATLSGNPLATYHLAADRAKQVPKSGAKTMKKGSRK